MPRGTKKNANPHNNRHENGIVAPGKRITKQKSNGHLNGSPDGKCQAYTPPALSPPINQPVTHTPENYADESPGNARLFCNRSTRFDEHEEQTSEDASEESESQQDESRDPNHQPEQNHRKIDVNAAKNPAVHNGSTLQLAITILRSCPLGDTLAILVFLLSLPPTFLTLTNAVFAMLTFMPPAGSFSSLPTLSDITSGSPGAPSLTTICITDLVGISLWLVVFTPVQSLALDMAQAVVATTLGGGYSSKKAGSDSTLLCMFLVSTTHMSRYKQQFQRVFGCDILPKWIPFLDGPVDSSPPSVGSIPSGRSVTSWFRILIALHILVQGLTRMVRRWYFRREYAQAASANKKLDPEAVAGSQNLVESNGMIEQNFNPSNSPSSELTTKSSLQSLREGQDKGPTAKKKKRQGTLVRSQQPLWAAFAATKVTVIREYEQSQAISDTAGSNAIDVKNLGSASFVLEEGKIWVTLVRPNSFFFDTSHFPMKQSISQNGAAGVDRSKPFYVRINGADWTSIRIQTLSRDENSENFPGQQWTGETFGLSPSCTYQCSFVRSEDDVVIHSATVSTPSSPIVNQVSSALVTPPLQNIRPSSPTSPSTTLRNSIAAFETSLNDSSAHQRRSRKDNKTASSSMKREIDTLSSSIARIGTNDKSQHIRQLQHSQHTRQAEETMAAISEELESLEAVPETDSKEWKQKRESLDEERNGHSEMRESLFRRKEANHRGASSVQTEVLTTEQKRERLLARISKLTDQHERLQSVSTQSIDDKERRDAEHIARRKDRERNETFHVDQITTFARSAHELHYLSRQAWQQFQALENALEQNKLNANDSRPITPEGDLPGTFPTTATSSGFRFPAFGSPDAFSIPHNHNNTTPFRHEGTRARSTSVLSGNSIYEDFSDPDPAPPMPSRSQVEAMRAARQHSGSSGSAGESSPMSPINGFAHGTRGLGGSPTLG